MTNELSSDHDEIQNTEALGEKRRASIPWGWIGGIGALAVVICLCVLIVIVGLFMSGITTLSPLPLIAGEPTATESPTEEPPTPTPTPTKEPPTPTPTPTEEPPTPTPTPTEEKPVKRQLTDCFSERVFCVGLVADVGEINDMSFNQSAWEGLTLAEETLGVQITYIESRDFNDYDDYYKNIRTFADQGFDVIVTVGFAMAEATYDAAAEYPDIDFIGVDQFQTEEIDNLAGLTFSENHAGFQAGALAAMVTETNTIAAVLGSDLVPPVVAFGEGYEAGGKYINSSIEVISAYHPGGLDIAFTDPEWGADTAAQMIDLGADVIFGAGGSTGNGALIETANHEGLYCIGVDFDQWGTLPDARDCLISSAMKLIAPGVFDLIELSYLDQFPGGNYLGETGLAPFHDFDNEIPQDAREMLEMIANGLADGSIQTGYNPQ